MMKNKKLVKSQTEIPSGPNRRTFIAAAAAGSSLLLPFATLRGAENRASAETVRDSKVTDFARSFCYCSPKPGAIWVRMQVECRCEVFDRAKSIADEYILGVRTQTGLHRAPAVDPGYDFWIIFSKKYVYNKRVHASSYNNNPTRVPVDEYGPVGWHVQQCPATPLRSAKEFRSALEAWHPITARSVFASPDGSRGFSIEYPVKWADCNLKTEGFRVETGPVILVDPERVRVGSNVEFEDFQWAYLDYHSFDSVRCILERPTPILAGSSAPTSSSTPPRNPPLNAKQVDQIEKRLFTGWKPPIPTDALQRLFQTNHYSIAKDVPVTTTLYALDQPCPANT